MKFMVLLSGIVALLTTIGHFTVGTQQFLNPLLKSDMEPVAKKVMQCVFHYMSVFLVLSTLALLMVGFEVRTGSPARLLTRFIALNYAAFAIWQFILAKQSDIPDAIKKLFQWMFFTAIAALAWIGANPQDLFSF
jgi:hypothetical protein